MGCIANANENEPYFLLTAVALAASGLPIPAIATKCIYFYVGARYAFSTVYLFLGDIIPQPGRAFCYLGALFTMVTLAVATLMA